MFARRLRSSWLNQIFGRVRARVLIWIGEITHVSAVGLVAAHEPMGLASLEILSAAAAAALLGILRTDPGLYGNVGQIYHSGLTVQFSYLCAAGAHHLTPPTLLPLPFCLLLARSLTHSLARPLPSTLLPLLLLLLPFPGKNGETDRERTFARHSRLRGARTTTHRLTPIARPEPSPSALSAPGTWSNCKQTILLQLWSYFMIE